MMSIIFCEKCDTALHACKCQDEEEQTMSDNPEFHQCGTCGYEWKHGVHGGHSCTDTLSAEIAKLKEENAELTMQRNVAITSRNAWQRTAESSNERTALEHAQATAAPRNFKESRVRIMSNLKQLVLNAIKEYATGTSQAYERAKTSAYEAIDILESELSASQSREAELREKLEAAEAREAELLATVENKSSTLNTIAEICVGAGCEDWVDLKTRLNENAELQRENAELEQRVKVLTDACEHCLREHGGYTIRGETERIIRAALKQTPQQTAAQIERWHIVWMEKQLPYAWLWRFEEDEEWHLSVGPCCPTYRNECVTVPLVAIPPLPKESKE